MNVHLTDMGANTTLSNMVLDAVQNTHTRERTYWKMFSCRTLGLSRVEERLFRMDPTKDWSWKDDAVSKMVRSLVESFTVMYYDHLTRVELLIQKPGEEVPAHRDRITGQQYGGVVAVRPFYDEWLKYGSQCKADRLQHERQRYLGGRLSLGPPGRSYIMEDSSKVYYEPGNRFFFLNEDMYHGADPVEHWRGVVFFDGIHNPEQMSKLYDFA